MLFLMNSQKEKEKQKQKQTNNLLTVGFPEMNL